MMKIKILSLDSRDAFIKDALNFENKEMYVGESGYIFVHREDIPEGDDGSPFVFFYPIVKILQR